LLCRSFAGRSGREFNLGKEEHMRQMKIGIALVALFGIVGCASEQTGTPGERLLAATRDANRQVDRLQAEGTIFTAKMSADLVAPVEDAAREVFDEMAEWRTSPPDQAYVAQESEVLEQASVEMQALLDRLGAPVSFYASEAVSAEPVEEECPTDEEIAAELAEFGFPAKDVTEGSDGEKAGVYWLRYLCRAACATAQVACTAACAALIIPPLTPLSPSILACMAACTAAGAICQDECSTICNR
jgi:hypothetical protein